MFPLTPLIANRICNSVISRKEKNRLIPDLRDTFKVGGRLALYAGLLPTCVRILIAQSDIVLKEKRNKDLWLLVPENDGRSLFKYLYGLSFGFFNLVFVRMSCIDYPFRNQLRKSISDSLRNDGAKAFFRGALAMLAAQAIGHLGFTLSILCGEMRHVYYSKKEDRGEPMDDSWKEVFYRSAAVLVPVSLTMLLMQPLNVISI